MFWDLISIIMFWESSVCFKYGNLKSVGKGNQIIPTFGQALKSNTFLTSFRPNAFIKDLIYCHYLIILKGDCKKYSNTLRNIDTMK